MFSWNSNDAGVVVGSCGDLGEMLNWPLSNHTDCLLISGHAVSAVKGTVSIDLRGRSAFSAGWHAVC